MEVKLSRAAARVDEKIFEHSLLYALYTPLPEFIAELVLTIPYYRMERQGKVKGKGPKPPPVYCYQCLPMSYCFIIAVF